MGELPTLAVFLETVQRLHPLTLETVELNGPRGRECHRYLIHENGAFAFLPKINDTDKLTLVVFTSLCRTLNISSQEFGIPPDFLNNPLRSLSDID